MWNLIIRQHLEGGGPPLPNQHAITQYKLSVVGFTNKRHFHKEADQLPVVPMSREKCQPEHFTLADKESGAVIFAAVVPPRDAGSKEELDLFYFYFPGSKRQILLELWNMNSSISSRYILSRNWRLRTFSSIFFFLERNNKKWVIIIGHEQQFIIGSSRWLGEKKKGGECVLCTVSSVLYTWPSSLPLNRCTF